MTKFIEIFFDDKYQIINIENIALIKRVDEYSTEFHLLTKDKNGNQITFKILKNYSDFRFLINEETKLAFNYTLYEEK